YPRPTATPNSLMVWLIPIAIFLPYTIAIFLGDLKLTPGKLLVITLVVPGVARIVTGATQGRRRMMASDFFVLAMAIWMVITPVLASGTEVLVAAVSQSIEFVGGYVIGRAFLFGPSTLGGFSRALKYIILILIVFAALDVVVGKYVISESM